jgi:hypothetical protein
VLAQSPSLRVLVWLCRLLLVLVLVLEGALPALAGMAPISLRQSEPVVDAPQLVEPAGVTPADQPTMALPISDHVTPTPLATGCRPAGLAWAGRWAG